ncbi:gliding motility-associated C-terminal domain-containing protein [Flavobacterium covae]|uniref:T9SS type B sorting domain-containing protein n=2 Tax=Flavobacterium covae TaxID=2906076 RepID=UPI0035E40354
MVEKIPKTFRHKFRSLIFLICLTTLFFLPVQKSYSQYGYSFKKKDFLKGTVNEIYFADVKNRKPIAVYSMPFLNTMKQVNLLSNGVLSGFSDHGKIKKSVSKTVFLALTDTDNDGIDDSVDLDDDNDGILDILESRSCPSPSFKMERMLSDFESGVNGTLSSVISGMNSVGITGTYTNGRKKPNNFSTNLGEILQMNATGTSNAYSLNYPSYSPVTPSGNYAASATTGSANPFPLSLGNANKVFNAATFSSTQSGGVYTLDLGTPKTPSTFTTTVDVNSFEFRKNLNQLTIYPSFVIEYDFFQANGAAGNEPGVYISNGVTDNLWANTGTTLRGFYTYRANALFKVDAAPFVASGTLVAAGDNTIDITTAANNNKWYHQKVTFSLNSTENILTITLNTRAYDSNGNLTGTNYQRSWTNNVNLSGNENWLRNFTAGISTDGVVDNVETYYLVCDSDNDGIANHLDLDSDNDTCSDANEYYDSATIDGGDNGVYGTGNPAVNGNGTVNVAGYNGSYTNVVLAGSTTNLNVTTQPNDQTIALGANAIFSATATGVSAIKYQWQESQDNGATWANVVNGGVYSGATTATLTLTAPPINMNNYKYKLVIKESNYVCGEKISDVKALKIGNTLVASNEVFVDKGGSVLGNDVLNGVPVTIGNAVVTSSTNGPLSIDTAGNVTVAAGTTAGTYSINYTICQIGAVPANCTTATATVIINDIDNDGVYDSVDLDNDNDGILDTQEGICTPIGTATWNVISTSEATQNLGNGVIVRVKASNPVGNGSGTSNGWSNDTFNAQPFWSRALASQKSLVGNVGFGTELTVSFEDALGNPLVVKRPEIHFDRVGGRDSVIPQKQNSALITLQNGLTWEKLINGTNDFFVTANSMEDGGVGILSSATWSGESTLNDVDGTAAGSLQLTSNVSSFKMMFNQDGGFGTGFDGVEMIFFACRDLDTDKDGTPDLLDLDSDNDGCSDANEYYNNVTADGGDGGVYGVGNPTVNPDGTVTTAGYNGTTIINVTTIGTASTITTQPSDQTIAFGSNATFTAAVTPGTGTTSYQWQESQDNGATWTDVSNGGVYSGATTATLTLTTPPVSMNNYQYKLVIKESNFVCGEKVSDAKILKITNVLVAKNDNLGTVATSATATTVAGSVLVNNGNGADTLNGVAVTTANTDVTPVTTGPIRIDADGNVTIQPGTASGTYTIPYTICETGATPVNCKTANITVEVKNDLIAKNDNLGTIATSATATTVAGSVLANNGNGADTLNGIAVTTANTDVTPVTTGPIRIDADGNVTIQPGTASGTYTIPYTICETGATPVNCKTANITVEVKNDLIAKNDNLGTIATSATATTVAGSVLANNGNGADTLNGIAVTTANTDVTPVTTGPIRIDADGNVTIQPGTASGTYTIPYTICETGATPVNCKTANITVEVKNDLIAKNDNLGTIATSATATTVAGSVLANNGNGADTLNGIAVTTANTDVTPVTTGPIRIDADGNVTIQPGTASGTYTIPYTICETGATPVNCKTANITVEVKNDLIAKNDNLGTIATSATATTVAGSVLANNGNGADTLNGIAVTTANTDVTPVTTGPIRIDADGNVTIQPGTASGTYTIPYTICETGATPVNCKTANITVEVKNDLIAKNDNLGTIATSATATTVAGSVLANNGNGADTLNGIAVTTANTDVTPVTTGPIRIDADGNVTIQPGTASGTYTIPYTICETGATPVNCKTANITVEVKNELIAKDDNLGTVATSATATTVAGSVLANNGNGADTLNGVAVTTANTDVTPVTTGPIRIDADGNVTIQPGTASGTYTIPYTICETGATPVNCKTANITVEVKNDLIAKNDNLGTIATSATATTVAGSVLANNGNGADTLNGIAVTTANTDVTPVTTGPIRIDADGNVTIQPGTASGTYTIPYTICETGATPVNCKTANITVEVKNDLIAKNDNLGTVATSATATTVAGSVLANNGNGADTLNGIAVTTANTDVTPVTTGPIRIDADGNVTIQPGTASGTYTIPYTICETGATPVNCKTANITVEVKNELIAKDDNLGTVATSATATTVAGSVLANNGNGADTLNGVAVTTANTDVTPVTTGPIRIDADGNVTIQPGTASGTYTIPYTICETGATPVNCKTANITVEVKNDLIAKNDNLGTVATSATATTVAGSVLANNGNGADTLNGIAVTTANTDVTPVTTGPIRIDADGNVTIQPGTASGTYTIPYTICETGATPVNCKTANITVEVKNELIAKDDNLGTVATSATATTVAGSVLANNGNGADTLNGVAVTTANTDVTPVTTGPIRIDADGNVTIQPGTASGTYTIPYTICETGATPVNCKTANITVEVKNDLIAKNDNLGTVATSATATTVAGSVLANNGNGADTLNGIAVTTANTDVTPVTTGPIRIDADGNVTIQPGTASGTYTIPYTICETGATPVNCKTANITVEVKNTIDAIDDAKVTVTSGSNTPNITLNDKLNGSNVTIGTAAGQVSLTGVNVPAGLTLNADGTITIGATTPSGTYQVEYQICENGANPANCDIAIAIVEVKNIIDAIDDAKVTVTSGSNTPNITLNDKLNGSNVDIGPILGQVSLTGVNVPAGLTLNTDGTITIGATTPSGTYQVEYEICENGANPINCDKAIAIVEVKNTIDAVDDAKVTVTSGSNTPNVTLNDKLNGSNVTIGTAAGQVSLTGVNVPAGLTLNADGTITIGATTPSGIYQVEYQICENGANPANCDIANAIVEVKNPIVLGGPDKELIVSGTTGTISIYNNDTFNGKPLSSTIGTGVGQVTVTITGLPQGITLNSNGTITVDNTVDNNTYTFTYTVCENGALIPNCVTQTVVIDVSAKVDANNDEFVTTNGGSGLVAGNVLVNDSINNLSQGSATINNVVLSQITLAQPVITVPSKSPVPYLDAATGRVIVPAGTPAGTYTFDYKACLLIKPGICDTATVTVRVEPSNKEEFVIYNHMTPNGDGNNDVFFIDGIDKFPNNSVEVYNRWGVLVYEAKGYNNNDRSFRGISSGRVTIKQLEELPEGTYYYMFKYEDTKGMPQEKAGYLYINR